MGSLQSLEIYLDLSRKELQGLCKKHNLPANRSHFQLAKSLASLFKKKDSNVASSKEALSNRLKDPFHISFGPESKSKESSYVPEGMRRGTHEARNDSSESDSYRLASRNKETVGNDGHHHQTGNQLESNLHMDSQTLEQPCDTSVEAVCPYLVNREGTKGFDCCTPEPGDVGMIPVIVADIQDNTVNPEHCTQSPNIVSKNDSQKSARQSISHHKMLNNAATNGGPSDFAPFSCKQHMTIECSMESGLLSSYGVSKKAAPALQFFVASEKGINLYVDLNSNPSDWINSMTDELSIYRKGYQHESQAPSNCITGLAGVDEHVKISTSGMGMGTQINGVERNSGCIHSSLCSVVSESCHSEAYAQDATAASFRSSLMTTCNVPVEITVCSEENQAVSSSCITCSKVQDQIASNIASCIGDEKASIQDSIDASFRVQKSEASVRDASLKSIGNMDPLRPSETKNPVPLDCHCLNTSAEAHVLGNNSISISEQRTVPTTDEIPNKMEASDIHELETNKSAHQASVETEVMDEITGVAGHQNIPSYSCQLGGELLLDFRATEAQSDVGSANHLLQQYRNSIVEDPMARFSNESSKRVAAKEIEQTESLKFQSSLCKSNKRSFSSEFAEEFRSKEQHVNSVYRSGIMMNLRSSKTSAKESIREAVVLPRRSARLVSK